MFACEESGAYLKLETGETLFVCEGQYDVMIPLGEGELHPRPPDYEPGELLLLHPPIREKGYRDIRVHTRVYHMQAF